METLIYTLIAIAYITCVLLFIWFSKCNSKTHFQKNVILQFVWDTYSPTNYRIKSVDDIPVVADKWEKYNKLFNACCKVHYDTHLRALIWREDVKKLYPKEVHHLLGE